MINSGIYWRRTRKMRPIHYKPTLFLIITIFDIAMNFLLDLPHSTTLTHTFPTPNSFCKICDVLKCLWFWGGKHRWPHRWVILSHPLDFEPFVGQEPEGSEGYYSIFCTWENRNITSFTYYLILIDVIWRKSGFSLYLMCGCTKRCGENNISITNML